MTAYFSGLPFICTASSASLASSSPSPSSSYHGLCCIRLRLWIKRTCDADSFFLPFFLRFFRICCCCLRDCGIPNIPSPRLCSCSDTLPEFIRVVCPPDRGHCCFLELPPSCCVCPCVCVLSCHTNQSSTSTSVFRLCKGFESLISFHRPFSVDTIQWNMRLYQLYSRPSCSRFSSYSYSSTSGSSSCSLFLPVYSFLFPVSVCIASSPWPWVFDSHAQPPYITHKFVTNSRMFTVSVIDFLFAEYEARCDSKLGGLHVRFLSVIVSRTLVYLIPPLE